MTRSPRRLREQVRGTVEEQVRDLPLHAVRLAMFGVGRALQLSDRVTRDYKEMREVGVRPVLDRLRDDAQHTAGKVVGTVVTRIRGTEEAPPAARPKPVPVAEPEITVGKPEPSAEPLVPPAEAAFARPTAVPDTVPEVTEPALDEPEATTEPTVRRSGPAAEDLPVPDYDEATLPQLRARLRGLSKDQVSLLREYERQHAARADVLRMYENRIAKLNGAS